MKKGYIDIVGKWAFIFAYDIEEKDLGEVGGWLEALGADKEEIYRAQSVLMGINTGFTFSNQSLKMSVICIGNSSDESQWWDTVAHEIDHLRNTITRYYDVSDTSEDAAYLQGYIMRKIIKMLKANGHSVGWQKQR